MKAVPILVVTNVVALALGLMAYLELDDLKAQRGTMRQTASRDGAQSDDHLRDQIQDLRQQILRLEGAVTTAAAEGGPVASGPEASTAAGGSDGKAIDRGYPAPDKFDEETELARPGFDYFRERVRLAQEANEKEDRINQQIDRLDNLITENRIGPLSDGQKRKAAEILLDTREKTRFIWRGLTQRDDLRNLPREEQREAYRREFRKERDSIQSTAQKTLEELMPAADAETLMSSSGRDMGGGRRGARPRSR
jgi:hypothetical protein